MLNQKRRDELIVELSLLAKNEEYDALKTWFSYWDSEDEKIEKCVQWCRFIIPHYFSDLTPEFHRELLAKLFSGNNEYFAAPRGFSKTTILQGFLMFCVANKLETFIVVIEKSFMEASEVLFAVRDEFANNPMIQAIYGEMISHDEMGREDDKAKDAMGDMLINGVRLRGKGFNTPIRGLKFKQFRPSLIVLDDVESDEHIESDEQRRKYLVNFTQGVIPAVDIKGRVKIMGTILHMDSLLKSQIEQHDGVIYRAFDPNDPEHTLLWPERWPYAVLMKKKDDMESEGLGTSKFFQEFLNDPVDGDQRAFKWEWLQETFNAADLKFRTINRYACIDVAESKKKGADFTGLVIVDWDSENNWFVQRVKRYKINITELIDLIFEVWRNWKPKSIGIEKKAFEDQVAPLIKIRSEEEQVYPIVIQLEDGGKRKEDRIRGALVGRFENKMIFFQENPTDDTLRLKGELYDFPMAKNDDLSDSMAYIQQLGARPFTTQKEQKSSIQQEFEEYRKRKNTSFAKKL